MAGQVVVQVELGGRSHPVVIDPQGWQGLPDWLERLGLDGPVALVSDTNVHAAWGGHLAEVLGARRRIDVVLPAGEQHKVASTWLDCVDALLRGGVDRRTPVVALGGGVIGDLAGFAAATTLRGLPLVLLPTSLLAMVDAAVGGKTAVNHPVGKNLVGAFYQPALVYAALPSLETLPAEELRAGLGEVVKTAVIGDADLLDYLEAHAEDLARGDLRRVPTVVERCVRVKAGVVSADELEAGWRVVLNAGHTVGHALEVAAGYGVLRHGEAVALGLIAEAAWAVREGWCAALDLPTRVAELVARLGLPRRAPVADPRLLRAAMGVDKKRRGDTLKLPVPAGPGRMVVVDLPIHALLELLEDLP